MNLSDLSRFLFPFRDHLEGEIAFLKAQLAQRSRKVDELQEVLIAIAKPAPIAPRPAPVPVAPLKTGWNAYRSHIDQDKQQAAERLNATTPASLAQNLTYTQPSPELPDSNIVA